MLDEKGRPIAFLCNGMKPCHTHPNCGVTHVFGQCKRTLDPKYAKLPDNRNFFTSYNDTIEQFKNRRKK